MENGRKKGSSARSEFERALDLVCWLQSGERVTASKIAERYELSYRSGQRLMLAAKLALPVRCFGERGMLGEQIVWQGQRLPR
jgi:predicted DNA-binding transcriptional regulator YafY